MYLPSLTRPQRQKTTVVQFAGYDHTAGCREGWFYEEENLSDRNWPMLSPRLPRTQLTRLIKANGLYEKNGLLWVDGNKLFYNGDVVGTVSDTPKRFCGMGSRVLIWPDKLSFDTVDKSLRPLGAKWQAVREVGILPSLENGTEYPISHIGITPPENPKNGDYWMDTSDRKAILRVYNVTTKSWGAVPTTYVKLKAPGLGAQFAQYDTVHISGFSTQAVGDLAESLNSDCIIWDRGEDYVIVSGLANRVMVQSPDVGQITLERRIPDLDYLTQQDNRIWGCNSKEHTIYACKQGDPTNWFNYMGTAADSYAVTVGSDGDFTGAATCMGYVLLFKAGCIHKVYGSKPANYQITTVQCAGVQPGAADTLVSVQGSLYYLSPEGVMRYDGSLPLSISGPLGAVRYTSGAAGARGNQAWFALTRADGKKELLHWNAVRELWHKEDALDAVQFAAQESGLYVLARDGTLWAMGQEDDPYTAHKGREKKVRWSAETGEIGLYDGENRFVSRLLLRLGGEKGTSIQIYAAWDDSDWQLLAERKLYREQMLLLPILPRRCNRMRLKLQGCGEVRLYSLSKMQEWGSEL